MFKPIRWAMAVCAAAFATHPSGVMRAQQDGVTVHELAASAGRSIGQNTATMKPIVTSDGSIMM
jgi:hypothetical protein